MDKNGQNRGGDRRAAAAANGREVGRPVDEGKGQKKQQQNIALSPEVWAYLAYEKENLQTRSQGAALEEILRCSWEFQEWQRKERERVQQ